MTITARHLQTLALDAQVVSLHGMAAQQRMDDCLAGWPSAPRSTSSTGMPNVGLPVDKHRKALEEFDALTRRVLVDLRRLASLSMAYGAPAMPYKDAVKRYLTDVDEMLYCPKCLVHGIKETKEQGRSICREHRDWQERHPGIDKPFKLLDAKARGATKAHMAKLYSDWLRENPQVQPKAKGRKSTKATERGTDVETVAGMTERFGGAA